MKNNRRTFAKSLVSVKQLLHNGKREINGLEGNALARDNQSQQPHFSPGLRPRHEKFVACKDRIQE